MIEHERRRWRALWAWFDDFPPDDQERLLGYLERLMTSTQGQDMGAFMDLVDKLFLLIDQLEAALDQERTPRDIQAT
jgi:hypothetical protein